jgi:hypothetical protein
VPVVHPLDEVDMHQAGSFFFILITEAFVDGDKLKAFRIATFLGDTELVGDGATKDRN